jgi:PAS domain S-box-containing protein
MNSQKKDKKTNHKINAPDCSQSSIRYLPLPYQSLDKNGCFLAVNPKWLSKLGYRKREIIGNPFKDLLPAEARNKFPEDFEVFKKAGCADDIEFELKKKNGSFIQVVFCARAEYDKNGNFVRSHCIWNDITRQKQTEAALIESEKKYRELVENTNDWVWETDHTGVYIFVSPNVKQIMGYPADKVIGKTPFDFMPPPEADRVKSIFKHHVEKKKPIQNVDDTMLTRNGEKIVFETNANPLFFPDGGLKGYVGTCRDVTEMRKLQEQVLKTSERLETLVEIYQTKNVSEEKIGGYVLESAIHLTESEIGFINFMDEKAGYTKHYSYSKATMKRCRTLVPKIFPLEGAGSWAHAVKKRRPVIINDYSRHHPGKKGYPKGHVKIKRFISVPVFDRGEIVLIASVANKASDYNGRDANQLILLMEGLWKHIRAHEMYDQLKSSLEEKDILLKEIHHRVKNNMQVIISLLKLQAANFKDPKFNQALQESSNRIQTMALIHTQLYQSENLSQINFRQYIPKICSLLMTLYHVDRSRIRCLYQIGNVSLKLEFALSCALILNEWISNSLKYAFPGKGKGDIIIRMEPYGDDKIVLEIADNGVGLPANFDWKDTDSLGLKIVKLLGEGQLGGRIAYSGENGTAFRLIFPK